MCYTKYLKHKQCGCWSVEIVKSCKKGNDFSDCPTFEDGIARNPRNHPREWADKSECPKHDKDDDYDTDKIRVVEGEKHGFKLGTGPNESDFGIDFLWGGPKGLGKKKKRQSEPGFVVCCTAM